MINRAVLRAYTPVDVIIGESAVWGFVAHVVVTQATAATGLAAAVVVGNNVIQVVRRVSAGTDPGHRGHLRAGRTGIVGAAATTAKETVDGTVAPIIAGSRIARVCVWVAAGLRRHPVVAAAVRSARSPGYRQQGESRAACQGQPYFPQQVPARGVAGNPAGEPFSNLIEPIHLTCPFHYLDPAFSGLLLACTRHLEA